MRSIKEMDKRLDEREQEIEQLKEELDLQFKDLIKRIQENNDIYLEEKNKLIKENHYLKNILTELEQYYKEQLEFIVELPVYTKDIAQEHKVMELCYEDFLNKIQELKEKYK